MYNSHADTQHLPLEEIALRVLTKSERRRLRRFKWRLACHANADGYRVGRKVFTTAIRRALRDRVRMRRQTEYEGKSFTDPMWEGAYEMKMPKRVLWYEKQMELVEKKIEFFQHLKKRNAVKDPDRVVNRLQKYHVRLVQAHNTAMKKVYDSLGKDDS